MILSKHLLSSSLNWHLITQTFEQHKLYINLNNSYDLKFKVDIFCVADNILGVRVYKATHVFSLFFFILFLFFFGGGDEFSEGVSYILLILFISNIYHPQILTYHFLNLSTYEWEKNKDLFIINEMTTIRCLFVIIRICVSYNWLLKCFITGVSLCEEDS